MLLRANVALDAANKELRELRGRCAHFDERGEHFRTRCHALEEENERLSRRNALLVAEREVGSEPAVELGDLGDLEFSTAENENDAVIFSSKECQCHGRALGIILNEHLFEIRDPEVARNIAVWMNAAVAWLETGA